MEARDQGHIYGMWSYHPARSWTLVNVTSFCKYKVAQPFQIQKCFIWTQHLIVVNTDASCPVGWGCRIHWLHFCSGVWPPHPNECPRYDTRQADGEVPVRPSLPGPFWPEVVAPDRVLSMGQIELNCILMLNWTTWNRTVLTFKQCTYKKVSWQL